MERPTGVTILAILAGLGAIMCVFGGIGMMFLGAVGGMVAGPLAALGFLGGVFMIAMAALCAATAYGMWTLEEWGRTLGIVLSGIGIFFALWNLITLQIFSGLLGVAINGYIIYYLRQPHVVAAFAKTGPPAVPATPA